MVPGWSFQEITNVLKRKMAMQSTRDSETEVRFLVSVEEGVKPQSALFGILLSRPDLPLFEEQIAPNLSYLHQASGDHVDFFCIGYGKYWSPGADQYKDARSIPSISKPGFPSEDWLYSDQAFVELVRSLESKSNWKYNGDSALLLLQAKLWSTGAFQIDFSKTIHLPLEDMIEDGSIKNVHRFIQDIIRMAEKNKGTWDISDWLGMKSFKNSVWDKILSLDPTGLLKSGKKASYFAVHDYSR